MSQLVKVVEGSHDYSQPLCRVRRVALAILAVTEDDTVDAVDVARRAARVFSKIHERAAGN